MGATALLALLLTSLAPALAAPRLEQKRSAGPLEVYPDDRLPGVFYFGPLELSLALEEGVPGLRLLIARYTGSVVGGDSGRTLLRSLLSFRVEEKIPAAAELEAARRALAGPSRRKIELRPLPIRRLEAALIWQSLDGTDEASHNLPSGHFEDGNDEPAAGAIWQQREFSLRLSPADAELLADSMQHGRLLFSLGYAFYSEGSPAPTDELQGPPELVAELQKRLVERGQEKESERLVRAGALALTADLKKHPQLLLKSDLDASAPPAWALVEVYCYDFADETRPELAEKVVELRAHGVSGHEVRTRGLFESRKKELYARTLRFPLAVRLDLPYEFRTTETDWNGDTRTSNWQQATSWVSLLDISSVVDAPSPAIFDDEQGDNDGSHL